MNMTIKLAASGSDETTTDPKTMFQRVLSGWAMDVLALRRRGWDRPCLRLVRSAVSRRSRRPLSRRAA